ncbi:hypothetical protein IGB42_00135 [Andreprevotia sp. IGB-42]|uniref:L,D-transpeptidase n=1 Tax=Andreprevotia sp. IGB-42 TaxID=2497473 RepID=UPI00135A61BF|nr:L,D-transpeptidase [Andreprevotia sp. IGB-42]KAF0815058.1 hypothetical protein IGB42_00135 [Andreprevotia sp. IGB-42]
MPEHIRIDLAQQTLTLYSGSDEMLHRFVISSARNGTGELTGSYRTPRGRHRIRAKIGAGAPSGAVFRGRRPTGEVWSPELAAAHPQRDWILSRILWLCGEQPGFNRSGQVDSMRRYIYIHGTPDTEPMGKPASHGCIRMRNADVVALFDLVACGIAVEIVAPAGETVIYPLPRRFNPASAGLKALTAAAPLSPVAAAAHGWHGCWGTEGQLLAAGRLLTGGNAELMALPGLSLPGALLLLLQQQAAQAGWLSLRMLAPYADAGEWQQRGASVASDVVEIDGVRSVALRWGIQPAG